MHHLWLMTFLFFRVAFVSACKARGSDLRVHFKVWNFLELIFGYFKTLVIWVLILLSLVLFCRSYMRKIVHYVLDSSGPCIFTDRAGLIWVCDHVTYWSWIRLLTCVTELRYECYGLDPDNAMWWVGGLEKRYYCLKLEPLECVMCSKAW